MVNLTRKRDGVQESTETATAQHSVLLESPIARVVAPDTSTVTILPQASRGQLFDNLRHGTKVYGLKNGMPVLVDSFPQLEDVGIAVSIRYGMMDDNPKIAGAAHLLEHMVLFKGTEKKAVADITRIIREVGDHVNAHTDQASTTFIMEVSRGDFEKGVELMADAMRNSTIPEAELKLEKGPVVNELLARHHDADAIIEDTLPTLLFREPRLKSMNMDSTATTNATTRDDLLRTYNTYYTPQNMVMAVSGGIKPGKAIKVVSKYMDGFDRPYTPVTRVVADSTPLGGEVTIEKEGFEQGAVGFGFKYPGLLQVGLKGFEHAVIASIILSQRMWDEIRDRRGLSYSLGAYFEPSLTYSYAVASADVEPQNIPDTRALIAREATKLADGEITAEEVRRISNAAVSRLKSLRASPIENADKMARWAAEFMDARATEGQLQAAQSTSLDEIRAAAQRLLRPDKASVVIVKPKDAA